MPQSQPLHILPFLLSAFVNGPGLVSAAPFVPAALAPRIPTTSQPIDPSTDEWSTTLSSISPLILLIGERTTKQVLRNIRSPSQAFSLASAPLGLLSIVTCLIRFCGTKELRAWIGYELEARNVVGLEVCRVNCGGVSAHLSGGWVVRTTVGEPASRLVGVGILEGDRRGVERGALDKIRGAERFEAERMKKGVPDDVVGVEWVVHITSKDVIWETVEAVVGVLAEAVALETEKKDLLDFQRNLGALICLEDMKGGADSQRSKSSSFNAEDAIQPHPDTSNPNPRSANDGSKQDSSNLTEVSVLEVMPTISREVEKHNAPFWNFTFMRTFDAVSEFTTSTPASNISSISIGLISMIGILAIHVVELWSSNWTITIGWILVMLGYVGIVFTVTYAAMLIHYSCVCIKLDTNASKTCSAGVWKEGMVVSIKNTDSMDTSGSNFVSSSSAQQTLEAVWIKPSTQHEKIISSVVTVSLVLAFISHYLGLRAMKWWASVGELCICLLASFARSVTNNRQPRFKVVDGVKIDKRCMSTGLIQTQSARLITSQSSEISRTLDARAYSPRTYKQLPSSGERIALLTAKRLYMNPQLREAIIRLTGMNLKISRSGVNSPELAIMASFSDGILLSEGIGFPTTHLCIAFRALPKDLSSPTALLARAIMRQPSWHLSHPGFGKGIPLGNVYIFSMQNMMDWWTLSEDRNDMGDLQRNLHWPMFLINVAFFVALLNTEEQGGGLQIQGKDGVDVNEMNTAENVVEFLRGALE